MQYSQWILQSIFHTIISLWSVIKHGPAKIYERLQYLFMESYRNHPNYNLPMLDGKDVIILVHGRGGSPSDFNSLIKHLQNYDHVYAISLGQNRYTTVENDSKELETQLENLTNCDITLIGNSKGGSVVTKYLSTFDDSTSTNKIKKVITVSSPLKGTVLANFVPGTTKQDLSYLADHLVETEEILKQHSDKIFHIVATYDHLILPADTAYFHHVPKSNIHFYTGLHNHICLFDDPQIVSVIRDWL